MPADHMAIAGMVRIYKHIPEILYDVVDQKDGFKLDLLSISVLENWMLHKWKSVRKFFLFFFFVRVNLETNGINKKVRRGSISPFIVYLYFRFPCIVIRVRIKLKSEKKAKKT